MGHPNRRRRYFKIKTRELSTFRRDKLGFIFQDYNLLDTLTVKENIFYRISLGKIEKKDAEPFTAIADILGIKDLAHKYPHEISGGQNSGHPRHVHLLTNPPWYLQTNQQGPRFQIGIISLGTMEDVNKNVMSQS